MSPSPAHTPPTSSTAPKPPKPPVRRARHLMDPNAPRPHRSDPMSLSQVQRWVLSTVTVFTILHLAAGLVVAAVFLDDSRLDGRIGLNLIAGVMGVIAVGTALVIHQRKPLSPWLALGLLPGLVGLYLTFAL